MGEALGFKMDRIVDQLPFMVSQNVAEYDPVVEALVAFVDEWKHDTATLGQVVDWVKADMEDRYSAIKTLTNSILLGRYVNSHTYDIEEATGLKIDRRNNQTLLVLPHAD
jgi:hypothetical protein